MEETAYAKAPDPLSECFINLGFNNWGWVSGPIEEGYGDVWDIWAGAGQCDTEKGQLMGLLYVSYAAGAVTLTFEAAAECCITEQQVYIGSEPLPEGPQGPTVAPGQYPYKEDFGECVKESGLTVQAEGPVYVIFHAVSCCTPVEP